MTRLRFLSPASLITSVLLVGMYLLPTRSLAEPTTRLYVGHSARLTAQVPTTWKADPARIYDYVGTDGFVVSGPAVGTDLEKACIKTAASPPFDRAATFVLTTWSGEAACRISGHSNGTEAGAIVIPHPRPFAMRGELFAYAALIADPAHLDAISMTINFSPDRVTPAEYLTSVLDIMEARAYWADDIDWGIVRRSTLASVEGLATVEESQGALLALVQTLWAFGDNHSSVVLPDMANAPVEASGYGLLVGGAQVLTVFSGGPVERAGIRTGDLLETVDGELFVPTLQAVDPTYLWGDSVELTIRRPGTPNTITVSVKQGPYDLYLPPSGYRLEGAVGYVALPHAFSPGRDADYATTANHVIASVDASPTCGWVVDLRLDSGGSYSPMITAVGSILGDGTFVGWRSTEGRQTWVSYEDGRIVDDGDEISDYLGPHGPYELTRPDLPVAVLIGPSTASAGEVAALAFVGRPGARLFGEPTAGRTTANVVYPLFDGARLTLAENAMTDRTGATHLAGVEPDHRVAIDWTAYGTADDTVLDAAHEWLLNSPECAEYQRSYEVEPIDRRMHRIPAQGVEGGR